MVESNKMDPEIDLRKEYDLEINSYGVNRNSKRKVIRNAFFNSGAWILTILISLMVTPMMIKLMGEEFYGIFLVLSGLIGYYGLLDMGVGQGIIKFVSEYYAKSENELLINVLNTSLLFQIITGFIGTLFIIVLLNPILVVLKISTAHIIETKASLLVFAISFFFSMIAGTFSSILNGLQKFDQRSKIELSVYLFMNLSFVLVLYFGKGLFELSLVNLVSSILLVMIYGIRTRLEINFWVPRFHMDLKILKELFSFSSFLFLSKLSWMFSNYFVRFLVGFILGPQAVTYYSVPGKLINAAGGLLGNGFNVLFPYISELNSLKKLEEIQRLCLKASRIFAIITVLVHLGLIVLAKPLLSWWISPSFSENTWLVLVILSVSSLIGSLSTVPNIVFMGLGYTKMIGNFSILSLIWYFLIVPPLSFFYGIIGTSLGMLIGLIPGLCLVVFGMRKVFLHKVWIYISSTTSKLLVPVVVTVILVLFVGVKFSTVYILFALLMLLVLASYFLYIFLHEEYFASVISLFNKNEE